MPYICCLYSVHVPCLRCYCLIFRCVAIAQQNCTREPLVTRQRGEGGNGYLVSSYNIKVGGRGSITQKWMPLNEIFENETYMEY